MSRFAASQLAVKVGPEVIDRLAEAIKGGSHSAMEGWVFEMRVFARLRKGGLTLTGLDGAPVTWNEAPVETFDPSAKAALPEGVWLKPIKWNPGGYDAVFVISNSCIRIVQATRSARHTLKIQYFAQLIRNTRSHQSLSEIEIVFVVPVEDIAGFSVSTVTGAGLLYKYKVLGGSGALCAKGSEGRCVRLLGV